MSIEEIIEELDKLAKKYEVCVGSPSLKPLAETYRRTAKILRAAIEKLKTHPDNQPNEPLTLDAVLEMDGQPVWIDFADGFWALVDAPHRRLRADRAVPYDMRTFAGRIYRRPPEEV